MANPSGCEHLIIQTAFLGDLLLGIPLLKELRRLRPGDRLTLLCRKGLGGLLLRLGLVDEAIEVDKSSSESWRSAVATLKSRHFEWLLCPHQSPRSLMLAARLRARHKIGYRQGIFGWVFSARARRPMELPEALRHLALLSVVPDAAAANLWRERIEEARGVQDLPGGVRSDGELAAIPEWAEMTVPALTRLRPAAGGINESHLSNSAREIHRGMGVGGKPLAFLAPGSVWKTKMWTVDGYVGVARALLNSGYSVAVMGSPEEKSLADEIAVRAPGAIVIAGLTGLYESCELLATGSLLVCNDSGAMHMAAMAGVPTVAIFGPTILDFGYRPWQASAAVVQVSRSQLSCRPCGKHGASACPIGTHECMTRISEADVLEAATRLLKISP